MKSYKGPGVQLTDPYHTGTPEEYHQVDDGRWHHRFGASWLKTFDLCPERARLEHELDVPDADASATGTAVHSTIETCLREYYASGAAFDIDTTVDIFHHELDSMEYEHVKWKTDDPAHRFGELCVRHWYRQVLPTLPTEGVELEKRFMLPLIDNDERVVELSGTIDFYADPIRDWKTSGRGEYDEWEYRRWAIQPTVYTWARYRLMGGGPLPMQFEYVVLGRHGVQRFMVERTPEHWAWLQDKVLAACRLIETQLEEWPKNDNHALCSPKWCAGWAQCKGKHFEGDPW